MADYLIQDPYHEYGLQFIELLYRRHGHRAVCFYTNRRERLRHAAQLRQLGPDRVAAAYDVSLERLPEFLLEIGPRHDIAAVIPFNETSVLPGAMIADFLGLNWVQPAVIRLFRDKFALKEHLRSVRPDLRINASCIVHSSGEVLARRTQPSYRQFILKPNDGYGNRNIGLFDRASAEQSIRAHLKRIAPSAVLMEEYIDGREYFVNGQIDAQGTIQVVAVFEYLRSPANGRHNLDFETPRVNHGTVLFEIITGYARQVLQATGLRRCPFHLELKVDDDGPCLIEVAARLPGNGNALLSGELHAGELDLIDVASHFYLSAEHRSLPLNWAAYNSHAVRYVHGVALKPERIYELDGLQAIEALPEFHRWVRKPAIGTRVERTVDCLSMPWSLILMGPTESAVCAAATRARSLIRWNHQVRSVQRAKVGLKIVLPNALRRIGAALPAFARPQRPPAVLTSRLQLRER